MSLATSVAFSLVVGLTMVFTGTKKKLLAWKPSRTVCPRCGRRGRFACRCRH